MFMLVYVRSDVRGVVAFGANYHPTYLHRYLQYLTTSAVGAYVTELLTDLGTQNT